MKTIERIAAVILTQFALLAIGHEDPEGDHAPDLKSTKTGFRLLFNRDIANNPYDTTIERIYDPSLAILEERQLSETEILDDTQSYRRWRIYSGGSWYFLEKGIQHQPWITVYRPNGEIEILRPKWPVNVGHSAGFSIADDILVISCNENGPEDGDPYGIPPEDEGEFLMVAFSLKDLSYISTLRLGRPSRIYSFPVSSEVISTNSKFYLGWVRRNPREADKWGFDLVVSEWNPRDSTHKHHVVEKYTTPNGGISIDTYANQVFLAFQQQEAPFERASIQIRKLNIKEGDERDSGLKGLQP
jgi:hypothetical protein